MLVAGLHGALEGVGPASDSCGSFSRDSAFLPMQSRHEPARVLPGPHATNSTSSRAESSSTRRSRGIVEGIVTIDDYDVHVRGFAADPERYLVPVFEASRSTSSGRPSTSR